MKTETGNRINSYGGGGGDERDLALSRVLPIREVVGVLIPKGLLNVVAGIVGVAPESDECRSFWRTSGGSANAMEIFLGILPLGCGW